MSKQPEALRLADILQHKIPSIECLEVAAAELRRLHFELEAMTQCAKNHDASRTKYLLLNQELLKALKDPRSRYGYGNEDADYRAAIAKAEGEQQ